MASFPCEAAALAAAAVHSAEASRSMRAVADCMAAAAGLAARNQQCGPAGLGPEIELDIELGAPDPSSDSSSSSSNSSSPASSVSSLSLRLEAFEALFSRLTEFPDFIYQAVLSICMGGPIYPSFNHMKKKSEPSCLLLFLVYCGAWIFITTVIVFFFLGKSKKETSCKLWTYRLILMALCLGIVLFSYVLIPHTNQVNIAVWVLICSVILTHVTAWNLKIDMADKRNTYILNIIVTIILPPLGVSFKYASGFEFWICVLLTFLGYIPGIIYGVYLCL